MRKEDLVIEKGPSNLSQQPPAQQVSPAIIIGLVPQPDGTQALAIQNNMSTVFEALYILEMARDVLKMQAGQQQAQQPSKIAIARGNVPRV